MRRLSLRARLVLGVIVLAALGLGAADIATYTSLRSFELKRVDSALDAAHPGVEQALLHGGFGRGNGPGQQQPGPNGGDIGSLTGAVPGYYVQIRTLAGSVVAKGQAPLYAGAPLLSAPKLPASISIPSGHSSSDGDRVRYFTVGSQNGDGRYRVRASVEPQDTTHVLVLAAPLSDVDSTLHHLLFIESLVTAAVLLGLALLGLWIVRISLRPLGAIERTAAAIAAGDLSRRVDRADDQTEVGRLGLALNTMLGQIESAFRARQASEQKLRRFVADASHELRTPLAAVRAYAELFTRGADRRPDDLARSMAGITRESERMSLLVDDLLLLARLDEGRPLEQERVRLDEVVANAVDAARAVEPERPITFDAEPLEVLGDHDRLRQIVDNLLANVRAHTPERSAVHVSVARAGVDAMIEVADSGPGLDDDDLARVFERFYRSDASRSRASGGVGLGLSIVAEVAESHGGTVSVRTGDDGGAVFRIALPLA